MPQNSENIYPIWRSAGISFLKQETERIKELLLEKIGKSDGTCLTTDQAIQKFIQDHVVGSLVLLLTRHQIEQCTVVTVQIHGLEKSNMSEFFQEMRKLGEQGFSNIILDMTQVAYINLQLCLALASLLRIAFINVSSSLLPEFQKYEILADMIYSSEENALARFQNVLQPQEKSAEDRQILLVEEDTSKTVSHIIEYYSMERVLKELQMEEDELKRLVSEGEIRAFRDEASMKFKKSDIEGLKRGRLTEPQIILPSGFEEESAEDSEVLLVEEDTSETLLDIDDAAASSSGTTIPVVDFTKEVRDTPISEQKEEDTGTYVKEEDTGTYVLESGDTSIQDKSDLGGDVSKPETEEIQPISPEPPDLYPTYNETLTTYGETPIEEELTFAEDKGSYELSPKDDILVDSEGKVIWETPEEKKLRIELDLKNKPVTRTADTGKIRKESFQKSAPAAKSPSFLFALATLPFVGLYYLCRLFYSIPAWIWRLSRTAWNLVGKAMDILRQKSLEKKVPLFEVLLSEDAGKPGPLERICAQFVSFLKLMQVVIGLKFILLINACDHALEIFTSYVHQIFYTWKRMKSIKKRIEQARNQNQLSDLLDDMVSLRIQLSAIFSFSGFSLKDIKREIPSVLWIKRPELQIPTFPLWIILETRNHIDEMKRDLDLLTEQEIRQFARKTVKDFLVSFVPNPVELFLPWKDWFILAFFMRYSREEIEKMYMSVVMDYQKIMSLLSLQGQKVSHDVYVYSREQAYEIKLNERVGKKIELPERLPEVIEKTRQDLQRLLPVLLNPEQFIYAHKWSLFDLLCETKKNMELSVPNSIYTLELDKRVRKEVESVLKWKCIPVNAYEKALRYQEAIELRHRYKELRNLQNQCLG